MRSPLPLACPSVLPLLESFKAADCEDFMETAFLSRLETMFYSTSWSSGSYTFSTRSSYPHDVAGYVYRWRGGDDIQKR